MLYATLASFFRTIHVTLLAQGVTITSWEFAQFVIKLAQFAKVQVLKLALNVMLVGC